MKVLGILGSPRTSGNTHALMTSVMKGCDSLGAETEIVELGDLEIKECDGCHACWKGRECPKGDDMLDLYETMKKSDAFVFGTPVYWYAPSGLMKMLIDRMVYFNCPENRISIRGKVATYVIPFEELDPATAEPVEDFFRRCFQYLELRLIEGVVVPGVNAKGEVSRKSDAMESAYQLGRSITSCGLRE
ncbi:MAG: flavodoxin family protein [Methanomassiliicoccales archaeon]|nr:flavodoxin family protein [Methanomassiliicoccales archaeon]NYT15392.1 flavodoxin family protein [Methanomassiliicoccales archaeon]